MTENKPLPTPMETAWAGGLFEGEGAFSPPSGAFLVMQDEEIVLRFHSIVQVGVIAKRKSPLGKDQWMWRARARADFVHVCDLLWPWLGTRRRSRASEIMWKTPGFLDRVQSPCGSRTKYAAGCRCEACREASRSYMRGWRVRRKALGLPC